MLIPGTPEKKVHKKQSGTCVGGQEGRKAYHDWTQESLGYKHEGELNSSVLPGPPQHTFHFLESLNQRSSTFEDIRRNSRSVGCYAKKG